MENQSSKAVVIAGGVWQMPLIKFLKSKGHFVIVVDPFSNSEGVKICKQHIKCDVKDVDTIYNFLKNEKIQFITTDQSDISVNTVAKLNELLGLTGNPLKITNLFVNKLLMREHAQSFNVPCPMFKRISEVQELYDFIEIAKLPIIIKPADSQSSRGIFKIETLTDLESKFINSLEFSICKEVIAEQFIDGVEITAEGFCSNHKHITLCTSRKKHFRTGIASELKYPADIPQEILTQVKRYNDVFVESTKLNFGITHAEYIIDLKTKNIFLIEIACRGGGSLISSDIIKWVSGVDVYEMFYQNLMGNETNVKNLFILNKSAILYFFEFPDGVVKSIDGLDLIIEDSRVLDIKMFFNKGDLLKKASDDRSRQGYFIGLGNNPDEINDLVEFVKTNLKITYE